MSLIPDYQLTGLSGIDRDGRDADRRQATAAPAPVGHARLPPEPEQANRGADINHAAGAFGYRLNRVVLVVNQHPGPRPARIT